MSTGNKPIIAITIGDPCGVGPEITIKSLIAHPEIYTLCIPVVIGNQNVLKNTMQVLEMEQPIKALERISEVDDSFSGINCIDICPDDRVPAFGQVSVAGGMQAFTNIKTSIELALNNQVDAIATSPINKEALKLAQVPYLDHTEILTKLTDSKDTMTLFVTGTLRTFFYSRHIQFKEISASLNQTDLIHSMEKSLEYLRQIGIEKPSLALAALNPHGGEQGMFGAEETEILIPAVKEAKKRGLAVVGPIPADSVFHLAKEGSYDAVLSLYHDQGHIATKTLDFHKTVSLTMGLPFLRTSVDHGTAFDIAGKGLASEISLVEAIKSAAHYYW